MKKLQLSLSYTLLLCAVFVAQPSAFAYQAGNEEDTSANTAEETQVVVKEETQVVVKEETQVVVKKEEKKDTQQSTADSNAERDFDKVRKLYSYDPATDQWSIIEDFETVDILENTEEKRDENYVYHSFWAYDPVKECWYKVDIRDYGYKLSGDAAVQDKPKKKSGRFWKNLALSLRAGSGLTFYQSRLSGLYVMNRENKFYLQTQQARKDKLAYEVNWLGATYKGLKNFQEGGEGDTDYRSTDGKKITYAGKGINIPVTLALHYTLFKRLRIGAGSGIEINRLTKLKTDISETKLAEFTVKEEHQWFYNLRWFGLIGFKILHRPKHGVFIDVQVGQNYNLGSDFGGALSDRKYLYRGLLLGTGMAYERKLNDYFKLMVRLSGDLGMHDDDSFIKEGEKASMWHDQLATHLEVGINFNFGRDREGSRRKKESSTDIHSKDSNTNPVQDARELGDDLEGVKSKGNRIGNKVNRGFLQ